jgi:hypothetical protein
MRGHGETTCCKSILDMINFCPPGPSGTGPQGVVKRVAKPACLSIPRPPVSSTVSGLTEPDATGPSPVAIGPHDVPRHAGQVVRRVLLRRNIVIDAETAELVAAAVQAALQAGGPSRPPSRGPRVPAAGCEPPS